MKATQFCRILVFACAAWLFWQRTAPAAAQQTVPAAKVPAETAPASIAFNDPLDTLIDPETYRLGPGDELAISILARTPADYPAPVSPDGVIHLPGVGTISVRGKTLAEVQSEVDKALGRIRKDFRTSIRLTRLRTIKVQVLGEVEKPGSVVCGPLTRVAEAIQRAGGPTRIASRRRIEIHRGDQLLPKVDLEQILKYGDESTNVTVETGDRIFVPRAKAIVALQGEVNSPGDYEVDEGESVKEVIRRAGGVTPSGSETAVHVERPGADDRRILVAADLTKNPPPVVLQDRDRIVVPTLASVQGSIRIVGAVKGAGSNWTGDPVPKEGVQGINSGVYLIHQGDRVRDVILDVGGLTSKADKSKAKIERPDGKGGKQVLPVNLHALLVENDASQNLELRDGDTLVVPTIVDEVYVLGQVLNPGPKQYEEGRTILNYVSQAGGVGNRARKKDAVLVRGDVDHPEQIPIHLDRMLQGKLDPRSIVVKPGDIIIVPEAQIKNWQDVVGIVWAARAFFPGLLFFGR